MATPDIFLTLTPSTSITGWAEYLRS